MSNPPGARPPATRWTAAAVATGRASVGAGSAVGLLAGAVGGFVLAAWRGGVVDGAPDRVLFGINMAAVYTLSGALTGLAVALAAAALLVAPPLRARARHLPVIAGALAGAIVAWRVADRWVGAVEAAGVLRLAPWVAAAAAATVLAVARRTRPTTWQVPALLAAAVVLSGAVHVWANGRDGLAPNARDDRRAGDRPAPIAVGMSDTGAGAGAAPGAAAHRPRNLLLINIDTLRADHLSCYGYRRPTSPRIDAFARTGVLFENALVQRPKTSPSVASLFTGTYPHTHGVANVRAWLPDEALTLPEILRAAGWRTAAVVSNPNLFGVFNFHQGFETHEEVGSWSGKNDGSLVNAKALTWLEAHHGEPFFLYVHYIDPHPPYAPPPPFRDRFRGDAFDGEHAGIRLPVGRGNIRTISEKIAIEGSTDLDLYIARYDEEISFVDDAVGRLLDRLDELGRRDDTLVVLTADHGESMTEHEVYFNHGLFPYQNNIRVPLIVRYPRAIPPGRRLSGAVQGIDMLPTLLDLLGLPQVNGLEGRSLAAAILGTGPEGEFSAFSEAGPDPEAFLASVVRQPWKLVLNPAGVDLARDPFLARHLLSRRRLRKILEATYGGPGVIRRWELYDVAADPGETRDLAFAHPEVVRALRAELEDWTSRWPEKRISRTVDPASLSPEILENLRSLGYVQ